MVLDTVRMEFDPIVIKALGARRVKEINQVVEGLQHLVESVPSTSTVVTHIPVALRAKTAEQANEELADRLERTDPGARWVFATFRREDGARIGKASQFISTPYAIGSDEWLTEFLFSDLHVRLSGWWLMQLWQAADLTFGAQEALNRWSLLSAAGCSRYLLEWAPVFIGEARDMMAEWDTFKRAGVRSLQSVEEFSLTFGQRLARLQFASQTSRSKDKSPEPSSGNINAHIEKLSNVDREHDVIGIYEQLRDATQADFGPNATYVNSSRKHSSGTLMVQEIAHNPLPYLAESGFVTIPPLALAVVDAVIIAGKVLLDRLAHIRWLIYDVGMTSEVAFHMRLGYYGQMEKPARNDRCPCGSGKKFKACSHRWGLEAKSPEEHEETGP
jgi:SEC-C motif